MKIKSENKKTIKEKKYISEEQEAIIRFVKILLGVIIFIILIYFATRLFVQKDLVNSKKETAVTEVNYSKMVFGTMLNRPYDEYYVFAYSSEDVKANLYSSYAEQYSGNKDSSYVYYVDLEDSLNKDLVSVDGNTNPKAKSVSELKVGSLTLIKVENEKIVKYLEKEKDIKNEFGIN